MKKIIIVASLLSLSYANDLNLLREEKKGLREVERKILKENHESSRNDWISSIDLSSSLSRGHAFDEEDDSFTKSVSIGFTQSIYESGGIELSLKYADDEYASEYLSWESENQELLQNIYENVIEIYKIKLELEKSYYTLKNDEIELELKKIQYEAGDVDITELNDAIMSRNENLKSNISLENSLKEKEIELSKYTDYKYKEIELLDFSKIDKEQFLRDNYEILYQKSLVELQNTSYKELKSEYGVSLSLSTSATYSDSDDLTSDTSSSSKSGKIALTLSVPLYDFNKKATLEESKLEVIKEKLILSELKTELSKDFDSTLVRIDTYEKSNEKIRENIILYDEMIKVNEASSHAGMSSKYDLEILENTKIINQYDIKLNELDIQLEYASLYFKIKGKK